MELSTRGNLSHRILSWHISSQPSRRHLGNAGRSSLRDLRCTPSWTRAKPRRVRSFDPLLPSNNTARKYIRIQQCKPDNPRSNHGEGEWENLGILNDNRGFQTLGYAILWLRCTSVEGLRSGDRPRLCHPISTLASLSGVPTSPHFPQPPTLQADNPASLGPAGTVHCSIDDWGKYAHLHMAGARGQITPILNSKSFIKLHTPYPGQDYTPGGWIRLEREWANGHVLTHSGSNTLNYASIWIAPQQERGTAYLAASNLGGEKAGEALNEAISSLIELP